MKRRIGLVLLTALSLSACNEDKNSGNVDSSNYQNRSLSVFGQLRPKSDPNVIRQMQAEEEAARQAQIAEMERQQKAAQEAAAREQAASQLPNVDTTPFSGSVQPYNSQINNYNYTSPGPSETSWSQPVPSAPVPPPASSYGINYTQPSAGFVPPPPAVSLSTSAVPMPMGYPPMYDPYANPYASMPPPQQQAAASRPALFGSGSGPGRSSSDSDDGERQAKKKEKPIQIITPTGMDARSPYKQRDELRILWRGALSTALSSINNNGKFADGLAKVDVVLPSESSRGSLSVSQRQVDKLFRNMSGVDDKVSGAVRKVQTDLVQAYYRYLYAFNKFTLTQQQVAARKQELDCAESQAEKQRATVDLAQSQQDADSSKEDMKAAQSDLASVVGAPAARSVIKTVSGVAPNLEAIAQAEPAVQSSDGGGTGGVGGLLHVFGFGGKSNKHKDDNDAKEEETQIASEEKGKEKKKEKKEKKKDKDKGESEKSEKPQIASKRSDAPAPAARSEDVERSLPSQSEAKGPIIFELKGVRTTPRKSELKVIVKNSGADNFSFDADSVSVADGSNKLAEAAVRAEFDSTVVAPSQEVTGTITIFGRPWNDKLTVSLSDGRKPIVMHR